MNLTKIWLGDADPATGGNPETGRLKEPGGLYIFTAGYVLRSVFLSIPHSYIKADLNFFRTLFLLEDSKKLF
ncbi:MAG: hypothetical protein ACERKJ_05985 [Candidatus Dadabacteria bacterium]|jgi:hypothetical protein